jgi:uncharacterized protein YegP (UPF0339 family)
MKFWDKFFDWWAPLPVLTVGEQWEIKRKGTYIEIYKDKRNEYRWRLKAANHKIIAESGEGYKRLEGLEKSFNLVAEVIAYAEWKDLTKK